MGLEWNNSFQFRVCSTKCFMITDLELPPLTRCRMRGKGVKLLLGFASKQLTRELGHHKIVTRRIEFPFVLKDASSPALSSDGSRAVFMLLIYF